MNIPSYLYRGKFSGIYCIENKTNGKKYVGSSKNMYGRLHNHKTKLIKGNHENIILTNTYKKYGIDNFECYSIEFCVEEELTICEQKWIDFLNPEYNITLEVIRNTLSQESREKISKTLKEGYKSGKIKPNRVRPIDVYDLDGNFVKSYDMIRIAARDLNVNASSIIRCLRKIYQQCKGYQFKYTEDTFKILPIEKSKYLRRFNKPAPVKLDELSGKLSK